MKLRTTLAILMAIPLLAPTAAATVYYGESFEAGATPFGWSLSGLWQVNTCMASEGIYALNYATPLEGCTFDVGATAGSAVMPPFTVPANGYLIFDSWSETEDWCGAYDDRTVDVSTDDGATWTTIFMECDENVWNLRVLSLNAYAGMDVLVRFHFNSHDSIGNGYGGWSVDNVILADESPLVPELPALGLVAAGAGVVGFVALRRRN